jgi:hypothetical protein
LGFYPARCERMIFPIPRTVRKVKVKLILLYPHRFSEIST